MLKADLKTKWRLEVCLRIGWQCRASWFNQARRHALCRTRKGINLTESRHAGQDKSTETQTEQG